MRCFVEDLRVISPDPLERKADPGQVLLGDRKLGTIAVYTRVAEDPSQGAGATAIAASPIDARPTMEVADILNRHGAADLARHRLSRGQRKVTGARSAATPAATGSVRAARAQRRKAASRPDTPISCPCPTTIKSSPAGGNRDDRPP